MATYRDRRTLFSAGGALLLCAVGHQALLRTEFPAAQRTPWDTVAVWVVWPALLFAIALVVWAGSTAKRRPSLGGVGLQALVVALAGYALSTVIDVAGAGIMVREAPLTARFGRFMLGASIFAVAFALVCVIVLAGVRTINGKRVSQTA
jgi:hypothetical protein